MADCPRPDKACHKSEHGANLELLERWLTIEDLEIRLRLHSYKCPCGFWHIGKIPLDKK